MMVKKLMTMHKENGVRCNIIILLFINISAFGMDMPLIPLELSSHKYGKRLSIAIDQDNQNDVESLFKLSGSAWKIEYLLSTGKLNANKQSTKGHALIHWATRGNNPDILEVLLKDPRTHRDIKNKNGCTALGFAVAQGRVVITKLLLDYGADPNIINENEENKGDHHSILHSAVMGYHAMGISYHIGYFTIIKSLLANVKTLVNKQDITGKTPLHYAVLLGDMALVNLFVCCNRVDQRIKDNDNKMALDYARETNKQKLIKLLRNY